MTSLLPGSQLGRYEVLEQIGRGGMATVFRALDPRLKRDVAVKVLPSYVSENPTLVDRFSQEARSVARLDHPNIITVHDYGEDKGFTYIVMEYLTGGTLRDRLSRKLSPQEALEFLDPLARALDYAHGQGIVHRDVKPSNVLLDSDGNPKLSDFGLARVLEGSAYLTQENTVLGTADYMSPEQALGRAADHRSDLYGLGIVLYQALLGRTPFHADTPSATLMAHIHEPAPQPTSLDPNFDSRLEAILLKALAKDPDDRHQSAGELAQAMASTVTVSSERLDIADQPTRMETSPGDAVKAETPSEQESTQSASAPGQVSLNQARLLAIQHSREDTDFYGPGYAGKSLVWEVISQEDNGEYYEIKLAYRPSGRFRGEPGVEQFTIGKTGTIELRQILDEPVEKRQVSPFLALAAGVVAVLVVAGVASIIVQLVIPEDVTPAPTEDAGAEDTVATPAPTASPVETPQAAVATAVPSAVVVEESQAQAPQSADTSATPHAASAATAQVPSPDLQAELSAVFQRASEARGLEPIVPRYVSEEEFLEALAANLNAERIGKEEALFSLLGLIPDGLDYRQLLVDVLAETIGIAGEIVAFYDWRTRELLVSADLTDLSPFQELVVVLQYLQALQDQHFGFTTNFGKVAEKMDAPLAMLALASGDAVRGLGVYMFSAPPGRFDLRALVEMELPAMANAPDAVQRHLSLSTNVGPSFVTALIEAEGPGSIAKAYGSPPMTSEQILHPGKYLAGEGAIEVELPDVGAALGVPWVEVYDGELGEVTLRSYLEKVAGSDQPKAATGWGGGRFKIFQSPIGGDRVLVALTAWDTPTDAQEFFDVVDAHTDISENLYVGINDDRVLLVIGPFESAVLAITEQFPGF